MQTTGFAINFTLWFWGLDAQGLYQRKYMEEMLIFERYVWLKQNS